ncbi:hypothetical protein ACFFGH_33675 [Lysobacter korlensis]|uniref:Uncharacterized protein n=1 Tax=Lysobacter korlensis TaxID=553636 RepID=A0ABV6S1U6_9GAMM
MRDHRITDAHAAALLDGHVPEDREDLLQVAAVVGALRLASFDAPPRPSAALAARLDLDRLAWVSAARGPEVPACEVARTNVLTQRPVKAKAKRALGWFTGLGVAAQLALGAGAVSASAAGVGIAAALPPVAQQVFDAVVATVAQAEQLLSEPAPSGADGAHGGVTDDAGTPVDGTDTDGTDTESAESEGTETDRGNADGMDAPLAVEPEPVIDRPGPRDSTGDSGAPAPGNSGKAAGPGHLGNGHGKGNAGAGSDWAPKSGNDPRPAEDARAVNRGAENPETVDDPRFSKGNGGPGDSRAAAHAAGSNETGPGNSDAAPAKPAGETGSTKSGS